MKKKIVTLVLLLALCYITSYTKGNHISEYNHSQTYNLLDTTKPVIIHTPICYCWSFYWPATVNAIVSDSSGIDSVWVKWYKNNPGTINRQFKLNNTSGNNYNALFNSSNNEVNNGDDIYYRLFARDNSSNHNIDSSQLYNISITYVDVVGLIGYGTESSNYPFTTYWMDGRTQILITASELNSCGINVGNITKIGFNVISFSTQVMNGLNVRFRQTTQNSLTGWVTTGWSTAFTGSYTVMATGWQYINLPPMNFYYNGTSNLLVEICYDNTSYTQFSPVYASNAPGMTWGYYTDNTYGCTMTGGSTQSNRPNIKLFFQVVYGINGNKKTIPNEYSLSQNYPNPFNPNTRIDFDIPKKGYVSLKVYDILGREVQTLLNEEKPAGSYSVDFNGMDLTSGVFFYRLEADGFSDVKRMILIK